MWLRWKRSLGSDVPPVRGLNFRRLELSDETIVTIATLNLYGDYVDIEF